jgi:hypothetical protein
METVKERVLISFCDGCIQKYACRRCCSEPLRKVSRFSQIINQLGNDRIGIVAYAGSASGVAHHLITVWQNVSAKHEH